MKSGWNRYRFEMTDDQPRKLLSPIKRCPSNVDVIISTYPNQMYAEALKKFPLIEYRAPTRQGNVTEHLYMNYTHEAGLLHWQSHRCNELYGPVCYTGLSTK